MRLVFYFCIRYIEILASTQQRLQLFDPWALGRFLPQAKHVKTVLRKLLKGAETRMANTYHGTRTDAHRYISCVQLQARSTTTKREMD